MQTLFASAMRAYGMMTAMGAVLVFSLAACSGMPPARAARHAGGAPGCCCDGNPEGAMGVQRLEMERQLQQMKDIHAKMMDARTAAEREAMMGEHMKAMEGGMSMMRSMMAACPATPHGHPSSPAQTYPASR